MSKLKLRGKDLNKIGYSNDISRSVAMITANKFAKFMQKEEVISLLLSIKETPDQFLNHEVWGKLAATFVEKNQLKEFTSFQLLEQGGRVKVYGGKFIETAAKKQMELAMQLPISVQGALMPDAHPGYGLPIGGVLATENAVIPYGVGVDIGCRMALSIFDVNEKYLHQHQYAIKTALKNYTHFGMEGGLGFAQEHEVLDRREFGELDLLKKLHGKAYRQLGSSGSGNHFVEFGVIELTESNGLNLAAGKYMALLSHSGSRGLGANIAMHYTELAMSTCKLPREAQPFAWLDLHTSQGAEYWMAMNLAGDYAKACHDRIHINLKKALGLEVLAVVENHHNFAWKEMIDGKELIVHRKGATPAHAGEWGIIPGSMIHPGYLVSGVGEPEALFSASHGAGRLMSRNKAKTSITQSSLKKMLDQAGVSLIGGSVEESPMVYKNIDQVMENQQSLVKVEGKFYPRIVRMNKE
jgi:tRNA-splicing ligase RtcB